MEWHSESGNPTTEMNRQTCLSEPAPDSCSKFGYQRPEHRSKKTRPKRRLLLCPGRSVVSGPAGSDLCRAAEQGRAMTIRPKRKESENQSSARKQAIHRGATRF